MNKKQIQENIKEIIKLYNALQESISGLLVGVNQDGEQREILDDFLGQLGLEKNEETRYAAYERLSNLHENALELYLENNNFSDSDTRSILDKSYELSCIFHSEFQAVMIATIEVKQWLSPFYLELLKGTANVGLAFNDLFLPWRNHIVNGVNVDLEKKFSNDTNKIMDYLNENNLFDKGHDGQLADRSYSTLVKVDGKYVSKSYAESFPREINSIVSGLDTFIDNLGELEDDIYDAKTEYIDYLTAIKLALLEKDVNKLVEKWVLVDAAWMEIKTPFQISHPLEFYEDKYRKAVAPEWDFRILNTVFESDVEESITSMYETLYDEIGREKYKSSYEYSLANQKRVQLYLTSPVLYYSSEMTGLFSAQVVPNDDVVSKAKGKKIFAFPEMVLANKRNDPIMKIVTDTFDKSLLDIYYKSLFSNDEEFYKIYDIETIGHEFGHTLWLDLDTESIMNNKTGVFKNIEEFKATTGGLVMYFMNESLAPDLKQQLLAFHIVRSVMLLKHREVNEIEPYYCEALIHLKLLFGSGIIKLNSENKVEFNYTEETYSKLKKDYIDCYKDLIMTYLNKLDASTFLFKYAEQVNGYYLPVLPELRDFVEYFYSKYKRLGNMIDETISKQDYK